MAALIAVAACSVDSLDEATVAEEVAIGGETTVEAAVAGLTGARASDPVVAASSNRHLVVWVDDREGHGTDIYAARIEQDGALADPAGFPIANTAATEDTPVVAWVGNGKWLVAWTVLVDRNSGGTDHSDSDIAAAIVSASGAVTPLGSVAATPDLWEHELAIAADGGAALLVYHRGGDLYGVRYGATGLGAPYVIVPFTTDIARQNPTVAGGGGQGFIVAWEQVAVPTGEWNLHGQRVLRNGDVQGSPFAISTDTGVQDSPDATFDGNQYVLTWKSRNEIWGARVSGGGVVLDTTGGVGGKQLATSATPVNHPAVACDTASCLFAWDDARDTTDQTTGVYGRRRALDFTPLGGEITIDERLRSQRNPALATRLAGGAAVVFEDHESGSPHVALRPRSSPPPPPSRSTSSGAPTPCASRTTSWPWAPRGRTAAPARSTCSRRPGLTFRRAGGMSHPCVTSSWSVPRAPRSVASSVRSHRCRPRAWAPPPSRPRWSAPASHPTRSGSPTWAACCRRRRARRPRARPPSTPGCPTRCRASPSTRCAAPASRP